MCALWQDGVVNHILDCWKCYFLSNWLSVLKSWFVLNRWAMLNVSSYQLQYTGKHKLHEWKHQLNIKCNWILSPTEEKTWIFKMITVNVCVSGHMLGVGGGMCQGWWPAVSLNSCVRPCTVPGVQVLHWQLSTRFNSPPCIMCFSLFSLGN